MADLDTEVTLVLSKEEVRFINKLLMRENEMAHRDQITAEDMMNVSTQENFVNNQRTSKWRQQISTAIMENIKGVLKWIS